MSNHETFWDHDFTLIVIAVYEQGENMYIVNIKTLLQNITILTIKKTLFNLSNYIMETIN